MKVTSHVVTHLLDADVLASEHCAEIDFLSIEADAAAVVTVIALSWNGQSTSGKSARLAIFVIPILAKHALTLSKSADVSHPAAIVFPPGSIWPWPSIAESQRLRTQRQPRRLDCGDVYLLHTQH